MPNPRPRSVMAVPRMARMANLALFLVGVIVIAGALNVLAQRANWRLRVDATKTRAYSLSEQTLSMLRELDGQWTIAVVMVQQNVDRAVRRQIDEVLQRFVDAAPNIRIVRVDPTDPRSIPEYESLLSSLRSRYTDLVAKYEQHLDAGIDAFEDIVLYAQQQSGLLNQVAQAIETSDPNGQRLVQRARGLAILADQGDEVLAEIARAREVSDAQPIPDYDVARSILLQALTTTSNDLFDMSEHYRQWLGQADLPAELRAFIQNQRREDEDRARRLAVAADPLRHLPTLDLAIIGRQLATGEAAVIMGPRDAAVIPSAQLFPRVNLRQSGEGTVTFDQRFRGEQLLASAIRSLIVPNMPLVVFVHAEDQSLLRSRDREIDLTGIATVLTASRFDVAEWIIGRTDRPHAERGQPVVYVVVPPPQRAGLEPSERERDLIRRTRDLIEDGESVMLNVHPSLLPRYGQADPWATLAEPLGLRAETQHVIFESVRTAADQTEVQRGQSIQQYESVHPIASAVHGQQTYLNLPVPIRVREAAPSSIRHEIIAAVPAAPNRWLEPNWPGETTGLQQPRDEHRLTEPAPLVVAAARPHPLERGRQQRLIMVGSGGWMLSYVSDVVISIGGNRVALVNPGNHELMLAAAAWLAGMDDLIARSPASQEVARLGDIPDAQAQAWFWLLVVALPVACLLAGAGMWFMRRR